MKKTVLSKRMVDIRDQVFYLAKGGSKDGEMTFGWSVLPSGTKVGWDKETYVTNGEITTQMLNGNEHKVVTLVPQKETEKAKAEKD